MSSSLHLYITFFNVNFNPNFNFSNVNMTVNKYLAIFIILLQANLLFTTVHFLPSKFILQFFVSVHFNKILIRLRFSCQQTYVIKYFNIFLPPWVNKMYIIYPILCSGYIEIHRLFQSGFPTQSDLVLPLSIYSTLSFT